MKARIVVAGDFPGDASGSIEMSVVVKNGKPKKIKGVSATYTYRCENIEGGLDESVVGGPVPGSFKVTKDGSKHRFGAESDADGRFYTFNGAVKKSGKKAEGTLSVEGGTSEGLPCGNLSTNWNAEK